jgi:nitroreductase
MVRSFSDEPVPPEVVDRLLDAARRGPSAGHAQGLEFVVLEGADHTGAYWELTLPDARRADFPWPGLLAAPVLVIPVVDPDAYVARYREPDKEATGLGADADAWPVPYWHVDAGAAVMLLLLAAVDEGLGALLFGQFEHEAAIAARFGIPPGRRAVGTVAVGHPAGDDRPSRSATTRPRRPLDEITHRAHW